MSEGKVRSAVNCLSRDRLGCVLGLDDMMPDTDGKTARDVLIEKHHLSQPACPDCLLPDHQTKPNPIIYDNLLLAAYEMLPYIHTSIGSGYLCLEETMPFVQVNITRLMQGFSSCWAEVLHVNHQSCLSLCF